MVEINFDWIEREMRACCVTLPDGSTLNAEELLLRMGDAEGAWHPKDEAEHAQLLPLLRKLYELGLIARGPH